MLLLEGIEGANYCWQYLGADFFFCFGASYARAHCKRVLRRAQQRTDMFSSASSTYSLKRPARCIAALAASEEPGEEQQNISSRFVVGTCSLREGNELHVLGFHEESNELLCHQVGRGANHAARRRAGSASESCQNV